MAFGNIALDLVLANTSGRLVIIRNGVYDTTTLDVITGHHKVVDVDKYYNTEKLRPKYDSFLRQPLLVMTSEF
jgi:6-phosphofructokinase 1